MWDSVKRLGKVQGDDYSSTSVPQDSFGYLGDFEEALYGASSLPKTVLLSREVAFPNDLVPCVESFWVQNAEYLGYDNPLYELEYIRGQIYGSAILRTIRLLWRFW